MYDLCRWGCKYFFTYLSENKEFPSWLAWNSPKKITNTEMPNMEQTAFPTRVFM